MSGPGTFGNLGQSLLGGIACLGREDGKSKVHQAGDWCSTHTRAWEQGGLLAVILVFMLPGSWVVWVQLIHTFCLVGIFLELGKGSWEERCKGKEPGCTG